jgi:hypothetical protein
MSIKSLFIFLIQGSIDSSGNISRITRAGLPKATTLDGISFVTTDPAPITEPSPILVLGNTTAPAPIIENLSTVTQPQRVAPGAM